MMINKDYPCNPGNYAVMDDKRNEYIVIHYVGATGSALQNAQYFERLPSIGASAHFFVGHAKEDGAVYQSVDPKDRAWHCGAKTYKHPDCRNANSIGIEMCCHRDPFDKWYFDDVTIAETIKLTRLMMEKYGISADHVLRHYDVTGKLCPAPLVGDFQWLLFKSRLEADNVSGENTGDNPSNWAQEHTEWAKKKQIINGDGQGNYDWQGPVTREAMAAMLHNFAVAFGLEKED